MIGDSDHAVPLRDRKTKATKVWKDTFNFFGRQSLL
jgi:hypothetical protein